MMSLWDALRMNMMISYQELVRTFLRICLRFRHGRAQFFNPLRRQRKNFHALIKLIICLFRRNNFLT
ncbi:hypothetical protein B1H21_07675 [Enterobacter roggenkampii]|nr:hypothetical protein B1H21_07675 [Enterobacter roggenkampii]